MSRRIATLWDSKPGDNHQHSDHEDDRPHGQSFYVGGSEHSGQQVLGPDNPNSNTFVENLFNQARRSQGPDDHQINNAPSASSLPIRFWRNGFTIGDEQDLHDYALPENVEFVNCIRQGQTPPQLIPKMRDGFVGVHLENKIGSDFSPKTSIKLFSGSGNRLGNSVPEVVEEKQNQPSTSDGSASGVSNLKVDDAKPTTNVQIRLADNSRLLVRINLSSTVADLISHIRSVRPQYAETNFALATTFPAKELTELSETIEDAKLANASVLQKIKRY